MAMFQQCFGVIHSMPVGVGMWILSGQDWLEVALNVAQDSVPNEIIVPYRNVSSLSPSPRFSVCLTNHSISLFYDCFHKSFLIHPMTLRHASITSMNLAFEADEAEFLAAYLIQFEYHSATFTSIPNCRLQNTATTLV
eukprot:scaffold12237_cov126-Amphora_coffeaeformis.AAC.2